ncbi:PREDICTED: probable cytochrome P450 310a1 [Rhagoletis zephyria]|uniref:probable cytochrome P450 310a1 n=1 Tax=Rhagoletis zephyria TaxID=28612 RepID=UPI00081120E2|nr:PREDICTED: probable cytochrome P450 310a1 [Rhagoletis zephyria]
MWLLIPILLYSVVFLYVRHVYTYWKRKGFPTERTALCWPFLKQVYRREFQYVSAISEAYSAGGERPLYGVYFFFRPTLLVRDVALARTILESPHGHFDDKRWHYMQGFRKINLLEKLATIFSVQRVEGMFRNVEKVTDHMVKHLDAITIANDYVDMQIVLRTYVINVFANLLYGLDSNIFEQHDSVFKTYIQSALRNRSLDSYTLNHLPKKSSLTYRLRDIVKDAVGRREDGGMIRKDIMQLLVKFRNGNNLNNDSKLNWHVDNVFEREKLLSIKKLSIVTERFLNIGFESTASAATLALYEILQSPSIHRQVLEEVRNMAAAAKTAANGDKKLTYADIDSLQYLGACIKETVRKYPSVPYIERVCRKNFPIPNSRVVINEGRTIMVPVMAMHRDERIFKDPDYFRPERFYNVTSGPDVENFMGFGMGAGICVARNFATMVIKLALVKLLNSFEMEYSENKDAQIFYNPAAVIKCKDGFKVRLKKHKASTHL